MAAQFRLTIDNIDMHGKHQVETIAASCSSDGNIDDSLLGAFYWSKKTLTHLTETKAFAFGDRVDKVVLVLEELIKNEDDDWHWREINAYHFKLDNEIDIN